MTKDALIEQLAELEFDRTIVTFGPRYEQLDEEDRGAYRAKVMTYWPLIVGFVSDWLSENGAIDQSDGAALGQRWLEEMSDA